MKLRFLQVLGFIIISFGAKVNDQMVVDKIIESVSSCNLLKLRETLSSHEIDLNSKLQHSNHSDSFYIKDIFNNTDCSRILELKPRSYIENTIASIEKVLSDNGATNTEYDLSFKRIIESNNTQLFDSFKTCDYNKIKAVIEKNPKLVNVSDTNGYTPLARVQNYICNAPSIEKMYDFPYKVTKLLINSGADINQYSSIQPTTWTKTQGPWFFNVLNTDAFGKESIIYLTNLINEFNLDLNLLDMDGKSIVPYIQMISHDYQANLDFVEEFNINVNQNDFQGNFNGIYLPLTLYLEEDKNTELLLKYYSKYKYKDTYPGFGSVLSSLINKIFFAANNDNLDKHLKFLSSFINQHPTILNATNIESGKTSLMNNLYYLCPRVSGDEFVYYDNYVADKNVPTKMYDWLYTILNSKYVDYSKLDKSGNSYFHYAIHLCPAKVSSLILSKIQKIPNVAETIKVGIGSTNFFNDKNIYPLEGRNKIRFLNGDKENLNVISKIVSKELLEIFRYNLDDSNSNIWLKAYKGTGHLDGIGFNGVITATYDKRILNEQRLFKGKISKDTKINVSENLEDVYGIKFLINNEKRDIPISNPKFFGSLYQKYYDYFIEVSQNANNLNVGISLVKKSKFRGVNLATLEINFNSNEAFDKITLGGINLNRNDNFEISLYVGQGKSEKKKLSFNEFITFTHSNNLKFKIDAFNKFLIKEGDPRIFIDFSNLTYSITPIPFIAKIGSINVNSNVLELKLKEYDVNKLRIDELLVITKLTHDTNAIDVLTGTLKIFFTDFNVSKVFYDELLLMIKNNKLSGSSKLKILSVLIEKELSLTDPESSLEKIFSSFSVENMNSVDIQFLKSLEDVFLARYSNEYPDYIIERVFIFILNNRSQIKSHKSKIRENVLLFIRRFFDNNKNSSFSKASRFLLGELSHE